jgi:hypothetical protein
MGSLHRKTSIMTIHQRAKRTVADQQPIARSISSRDVFDLANNAQPGINLQTESGLRPPRADAHPKPAAAKLTSAGILLIA